MRELSELEKTRIQILINMGIPFTLIEPTETGLRKSIMDATSSVRDFLLEQNLHDYSTQKQGASKNKVIIKSFLLNALFINFELLGLNFTIITFQSFELVVLFLQFEK